MNLFDLAAKISLDSSSFESGLKKASGVAASFGSTLTSGLATAAKVTAGAVTAASGAVTAFSAYAINAANQQSSAFAQVATIMDTTQVSYEDMTANIKALSSEMGISVQDLSSTVYNAISATGDTVNAVSLASQAAKLATAGFTDTDSALSVLTTSMNAYGLSAEEAARISDSLIMVQNLGVTTVADLSSSMGKAIASASAYGVDLSNVESAYVSMTKAGISTAESTTYLSSMLKELGTDGSGVDAVLKELTGKGFSELMKDGMSLADVLQVLYDSVDGDATALMNMWSSAEAGKASNAILSQGLKQFNTNLKTIASSAGATQTAYETMAGTFQHQIDVLKTSAENFSTDVIQPVFEDISSNLLPMALDSMELLTEAYKTDGIQGMMEASSIIIQQIITTITEYLPLVLDAGISLIETIATALIDNLPLIIEAAVNVIMNITSTIIEHLPEIIELGINILITLIDGIVKTIPQLVPALVNAALTITNTLTKPETIGWLVDAGVTVLIAVVNGIIKAIPELIPALTKAITTIVEKLTEPDTLTLLITAAMELIFAMAVGLVKAVPDLVAKIPTIITNLISAIVPYVADFATMGGQLLQGLWNGISDTVGWIVEKIKGMGQLIIDAVKAIFGIHSPSRVFAGIGENLALGLGEGWEDEIKDVKDDINSDLNFDAASNIDVKGTATLEGVNAILTAIYNKLSEGGEVLIDGQTAGVILAPYISRQIAWGE